MNIVVYRIKEEVPSSIKYLTYFLLAWVILQGTFGYLTVSLKLLPQIVTGHLMFGFLTTLLIWLLYFKAKDELDPERKKWLFSDNSKKLISVGMFLVTVQIFLGAWTSTNYASYSCTDFPLCQGQLMPEVDFEEGFNFFQSIGPNYLGGQLDHEARLAIHMTHRIGALIVSAYLIFLAYHFVVNRKNQIAFGILGILTLQVLLGISNIIFALPLLVAVGHNLGGLLLITYLSVLRFRE